MCGEIAEKLRSWTTLVGVTEDRGTKITVEGPMRGAWVNPATWPWGSVEAPASSKEELQESRVSQGLSLALHYLTSLIAINPSCQCPELLARVGCIFVEEVHIIWGCNLCLQCFWIQFQTPNKKRPGGEEVWTLMKNRRRAAMKQNYREPENGNIIHWPYNNCNHYVQKDTTTRLKIWRRNADIKKIK